MGTARGNRGTELRGAKEENWDKCNSIINKIYLKIKKEVKRGAWDQISIVASKKRNFTERKTSQV